MIKVIWYLFRGVVVRWTDKMFLWSGWVIRAIELVGSVLFGVAAYLAVLSWVATVPGIAGGSVLVTAALFLLVAGPFIRFLRWVEPDLFRKRGSDKGESGDD